MTTSHTDEAWASVRAADLDDMDRDAVVAVLGCAQRARSHLDAFEMRAARRLRELSRSGRCEPPGAAIAAASSRSSREADAVTERDTVCAAMPDVEDALESGDITGPHVDAIADAARSLPPEVRAEFEAVSDDLLRRASLISLDAFRKQCRDLAKSLRARHQASSDVDELTAQRNASKVTRWTDRRTGMHHTMLELDPVRDAVVDAAVEAEMRRLRQVDGNGELSWQQLQITAWINTTTGAITQDADADHESGAAVERRVDRVPEVTLLVDAHRLLDDALGAGLCETADGTLVPIETARRLCCDAEVLPCVLDGDGAVLDQGRSRRTATREQRRALRAMHRTCAHPGCGVGFDACRIHHVIWWRFGGLSDIENLIPLCERHHHLVHEGGWALALDTHRVATWTRPDGAVHHRGPTISRRDERADRADPVGRAARSSAGSQPTLV